MANINYGGSGDARLTAGNPSETELTATHLDLCRRRATDVVNSYLEIEFSDIVPWTASGDVPSLINDITNDLAVYYVKRDLHPGVAPLSEEDKAEFWEKPIDLLTKIKNREIQLPELTSIQEDEIQGKRIDYTPTFDLDDTLSQAVDSDLLDDIAENR